MAGYRPGRTIPPPPGWDRFTTGREKLDRFYQEKLDRAQNITRWEKDGQIGLTYNYQPPPGRPATGGGGGWNIPFFGGGGGGGGPPPAPPPVAGAGPGGGGGGFAAVSPPGFDVPPWDPGAAVGATAPVGFNAGLAQQQARWAQMRQMALQRIMALMFGGG